MFLNHDVTLCFDLPEQSSDHLFHLIIGIVIFKHPTRKQLATLQILNIGHTNQTIHLETH